jgi:hypothetical protein
VRCWPERVTALLEALAADLLCAASQASKELFHSNMLAWYLEHHARHADRYAKHVVLTLSAVP